MQIASFHVRTALESCSCWLPKPYHNMRSSRETELVKNHPLHVVTAWLGNTPKIAMKHYFQVTDDDFAEAIGGGAKSGATMVQNTVQQPVAPSGKNRLSSTQTPVVSVVSADSCGWLPDDAESQDSGGGIRTPDTRIMIPLL